MAEMPVPLSPRVRVSGYRRLRDVDFALHPLTVLIGPNGVGKTAILEVMSLLAASASSRLKASLSDLHGIASVLTHNGPPRLSFEVALTVGDGAPLEYTLSLIPTANLYSIEAEKLTQSRGMERPFVYIDSRLGNIVYYDPQSRKLRKPVQPNLVPDEALVVSSESRLWSAPIQPNWQHDPSETSLAQVPKMFQEAESFRRILGSSTLYHSLDISSRARVRLPQQMTPSVHPGPDGEELTSFLYYLRETNRNIFESIEDTLRAAFPKFVRLDFPPVAAGTITFTWKDSNFSTPMYPYQLSEGTLRFLWLVSLLHSPELPRITLLDEPEVSLHPEMLDLLASLLREASQRTQLIVATHSDRLVRSLEPKELAVMDLDDSGGAKITWADSLDLQQWMRDYTLDDLWQMGRLGGRS